MPVRRIKNVLKGSDCKIYSRKIETCGRGNKYSGKNSPLTFLIGVATLLQTTRTKILIQEICYCLAASFIPTVTTYVPCFIAGLYFGISE